MNLSGALGNFRSSLARQMQELQQVDFANLDLQEIGSWPALLQGLALILLYALLMFGVSYLHVQELEKVLASEVKKEEELRAEYSVKAFEVGNLEAYKAQLEELEARLGVLISQLPSDAEVPGLLDDITDKGELNGLSIGRIDLLEEQPQRFYAELPIEIEAVGSYHDFGAFISGLAALPRIVTVDDFNISVSDKSVPMLDITVLAKTYRYEGEADGR